MDCGFNGCCAGVWYSTVLVVIMVFRRVWLLLFGLWLARGIMVFVGKYGCCLCMVDLCWFVGWCGFRFVGWAVLCLQVVVGLVCLCLIISVRWCCWLLVGTVFGVGCLLVWFGVLLDLWCC